MEDAAVSDSTIPQKRCVTCKNWLPATVEIFGKRSKYPDGLNIMCKECRRAYDAEWRDASRDKIRETGRRYRENNPEQVAESRRSFHERHPGIQKEYWRRFYSRHRTVLLNKSRQYNLRNKEKVYQRILRYRATNRATYMAVVHRRLARKHALPDNFREVDWNTALAYFHGCCAYCGSQQSLWHTIEMDHYVPLSNQTCPGTVPKNMVPACKSCNLHKSAKDPVAWINDTFGKRKAKQIIARIGAYFDSLV